MSLTSQLVYTPMINAKMFADNARKGYRDQNFNIPLGEEGGPQDRPLIVQVRLHFILLIMI